MDKSYQEAYSHAFSLYSQGMLAENLITSYAIRHMGVMAINGKLEPSLKESLNAGVACGLIKQLPTGIKSYFIYHSNDYNGEFTQKAHKMLQEKLAKSKNKRKG